MSSVARFAMRQTCLWSRREGIGPFGDVQWGEPQEILCRTSFKHRLILDDQGEERTSGALVTTLAPVEVGDRLTIDGRVFEALEVHKPVDFEGREARRKVFV